MNLNALDSLLDKTPVMARINPVSLSFLSRPVHMFSTAREMALAADAPTQTTVERWLTLDTDSNFAVRFPTVACDHDPFTSELNRVLFADFDRIAQRMSCQSQIADRIEHECSNSDVIVLIIVDGLSYADCKPYLGDNRLTIDPCLVDVPTITRLGYLNVVGALRHQLRVAERLFRVGFEQRLGFTYWEREENTLTDRLFYSFGEVIKSNDFSTILSSIQRELGRSRVYIQIVRTALDGYVHHQKRKVKIDGVVDEVFGELFQIADVLKTTERRARLYLTADHGLLWREDLANAVVLSDARGSSPRYVEVGARLTQQYARGKRFECDGGVIYCLDHLELNRPLNADEQAVHGGISFQESIVPLVTMEIIHAQPR